MVGGSSEYSAGAVRALAPWALPAAAGLLCSQPGGRLSRLWARGGFGSAFCVLDCMWKRRAASQGPSVKSQLRTVRVLKGQPE